jgi:predicted enzyme related to lactoylglutathione lyase
MARVVHFEIHADSPERAVTFYSKLFGWEFTKWGGPMEYWLIKTGPDDQRGINGGLIKRHGVIDGTAVIAYVCTVSVDSVDATAAKLAGLGGTIVVPKMAIPGIGWLVYAKDTEGNIFGFMTSDPTAK